MSDIISRSFGVSAMNATLLNTSFGLDPINQAHTFIQLNGACILPVSGLYGFMPRMLYYVLLIFAILVRQLLQNSEDDFIDDYYRLALENGLSLEHWHLPCRIRSSHLYLVRETMNTKRIN